MCSDHARSAADAAKKSFPSNYKKLRHIAKIDCLTLTPLFRSGESLLLSQ